MSEKDFKFYMPVDLAKSENEDDEWRIQGLASTDDQDIQGETVDQTGLDISLLKAGRGLWNWDHQKGPENILGEIEDAEFVDIGGGRKGLMVKGYLFKHQERAKAFYNIMRSMKKSGKGSRVHLSIEGKILQRDFSNPKAIKKARIDKIALTLDPVNPYTYADLCKSLNSPEPAETFELELKDGETIEIKKSDLQTILDFCNKALAAGVGGAKAPAQRVGGEAMGKESLESNVKNVAKDSKKKKDKKDMLKSLMKSLRDAHPNEDPMNLVEMVFDVLVDKIEGK